MTLATSKAHKLMFEAKEDRRIEAEMKKQTSLLLSDPSKANTEFAKAAANTSKPSITIVKEPII